MKSSATNRKELFSEWCEITSCAGAVDWHLARTYQGKIFWTIFLSVGLGLTIWQTATVIVGFVTDDHFHTTLTVKSDLIPFPNITLCNVNRINRHLLNEFENETTMLSYALMPAAINYLRSFDSQVENFDELDQLWIKFKTHFNVSDIKSLFQIFGPSCNEVFFECKWGFTPFNCCDFATEILTTYGRCWTLRPPTKNSQTMAFQPRAGVYDGLQLILNPNLDQYVKGLVYNSFPEEGFFVDIGFVQQAYMINFKVLQPGTHSWLAMTARKQTVKTSNFQIYTPNCSLYQKFEYVLVLADYSKFNCEQECELVGIYHSCHCLPMSTIRSEYIICSPLEMLNCIYDYFNLMSTSASIEKCKSKCFPSCDPYWTVHASQTSTKFIGQHVNDQFQKILVTKNNTIDGKTGKLSEDNVNTKICLNVYYETLDYMEVQLEETNPIFVFIGNIGGQLSLWLGISIVTVVQALYYIIACLVKKP